MTVPEILAQKNKRNLSMITCYDYFTSQILAQSSIDMILVGDSAAMVIHGYSDTLPATIDMIKSHVLAVRKGAPNKFIVADMPFLAHRLSRSEALKNVQILMQAGANALKIEGVWGNEDLFKDLQQLGIPLMGHLGLTPQFINSLGGFKVQGKSEEQQKELLKQAEALQGLGAFALVLECVPSSLAQAITSQLNIPTIGIGAGPDTDGQVLVLQDLLGLTTGFKPKFVRQYLDGAELFKKSLEQFHQDVVSRRFPSPDESYESKNKEFAAKNFLQEGTKDLC